jgi:hypothetical protein
VRRIRETLAPSAAGDPKPGGDRSKFQFIDMVYQYSQLKPSICINKLTPIKPARFSDFAQVSPPKPHGFAESGLD